MASKSFNIRDGFAIIFVIDATIGILDHRAFVYLPMCKPRPQICF